MPRSLSGPFAALATLLVTVLLTWPLATGLLRHDAWISRAGGGSEAYGTEVMHQRVEMCLRTALAEPPPGEAGVVTQLLAPTRCAFRTGSWNVVDIVAFAMPLKHAFGPIAHWNALFLVILWLNAWSGWHLGRRFGGHAAGGAVGVLVLSLSPLLLSQAYQGRPIVAMLFPFGPVLVGLDRILRGEAGWAGILLTGAALGLLVNTYWYNAHFLALLLPGLVPALLAPGPRPRRVGAVAAVGLVGLLLAAPGFWQFRELSRTPGAFPEVPAVEESARIPQPGTAEPRPDQLTILVDSLPTDGLFHPVASWLPVRRDNLGWIPGGLLALGAVGLLRGRSAFGWAAAFLSSWVLSLGPWPHAAAVDSMVNTEGPANPLYQAFYAFVPLARNMRHPDRFVVPMLVALAALAAAGASLLAAGELPGQRRRGRVVSGLLAVALLAVAGRELVQAHLFPVHLTSVPVPAALTSLSGRNLEVLHLPTVKSRGAGAPTPASLQLENRILGWSVFHGGCVARSLSDAPGRIPRHATSATAVRALAALDSEDASAIASLGPDLLAGLHDAGVQILILDEGGYITLRGVPAGRAAWRALYEVLAPAMGPATWEGQVINGLVFPAQAQDGEVPNRISLAVYRVP